MKITHIKQQINDSNRVSVFVDGDYSFSLTLDQILEQKLKKGLELDGPRLEILHKISDEGKIRTRALEWLLRRPHSVGEFKNYSYRKKLEKDLVEKLIAEFQDRGYLDDEKFAIWFADQRIKKGKSIREVRAELMAKGISFSVSEFVTDSNSDEDALVGLIKKLQTRSRYQEEKKLLSYLLSKGFRYSDIKTALEKVEESE